MALAFDKPKSVLLAASCIVGALGVAAYYFKREYTPAVRVADAKTKALYESWRSGPWFVSPQDVKGTARVVELRVHPIKSCKGISVQEVLYTPLGFQYDRQWCIVDDRSHKTITQREEPSMAHISSHIDLQAGVLHVSFPPEAECESFQVPLEPSVAETADWPLLDDVSHFSMSAIEAHVVPMGADSLSMFLRRPVMLVTVGSKLRKADRTGLYPTLDADMHFQDDSPLSLVSKESVAAVGQLIHQARRSENEGKESNLDWRRFRANIVVEGAGVPFAEDAWQEVAFEPKVGSRPEVIISITARQPRCPMPNVDQDTGEVDRSPAAPLKVLLSKRTNVALEGNAKANACMGVNGLSDGTGAIRIGDAVRVKKWIHV